jgi:hypothetical protein
VTSLAPSSSVSGLGRRSRDRRPGRPGRPRWPRERRARCDSGSSVPELLLVLPAVVLMFTLALQVSLWALAAHALSDAVAQGGAALRAQGGSSAAARTAVERELASIAGGLVNSPSVSISAGPDGQMSLAANGSVPSLLPGFHLRVSATSVGPSEKFRAAG